MVQIDSGESAVSSAGTGKTAQRKRRSKEKAMPVEGVRATPVIIAADASVDSAIATIFSSARDHWVANERGVNAGLPEAVHQFRVGLRRFRSALSLFRKFIPEAQRRWANEEAKWILSEFGPTRDLDVFAAELLPSVTKPKHRAAMKELKHAAAKARKISLGLAQHAMASARYARFMRRLDIWLAGAGWRAARDVDTKDGGAIPATQFAARTVNRRVLKVLSHGKSLDAMSVAERHQIRIAIKKIRYGIEFFDSILPKRRVQRMWQKLKALQDSLGHLNDVAVAEQTVAMLLAPGPDGTTDSRMAMAGAELIAWHQRLEEAARPEAAKRWRELRKAALF
ncbi:MAG: CHAD domain-containing protein [Rhodobacteraceae bacterium]|nr:CHAD domain-containing protein [Paracoccaceae bacterium]